MEYTNDELIALINEKSSLGQSEFNKWFESLSKNNKSYVQKEMKARKLVKAITPSAVKITEETSSSSQPPAPSIPKLVPSDKVSDSDLISMWSEIDALDVSSIDRESLRIFEYQGFNPDEILKSLIIAQRKNKISGDQFKTDILTLCAISIIKGSINDHNFGKISKEGQDAIVKLENSYGIKRGSGRGMNSSVVTVSRIAATFPGIVIQLLRDNKVSARKFIGPLKSQTLPAVMRHQAFAAVIPVTLREKTRNFLLSLITAFSVDQSINISPNKKEKPDVEGLFKLQENFIQVSADNFYPPESIRVKIFKSVILDYDDLLTCARSIGKFINDIIIPSKDEFMSDISQL